MFLKEETFQNTSIGKIPKEWDVCPIEDLFEFLDNQRIPLKEQDRAKRKGNYPYYGAQGIIDRIDDYIFEGEHILLAEDGANLKTRVLPLAYKVTGKFWVNNHAHVLKRKDNLKTDFFVYLLNSIDIGRHVVGSAQPKLNQADARKILLPLPSFMEQMAIAEVLGVVDSAIELTDQVIEKTERLKRGLIQQLLTRGIGHAEYKQTEVGIIPKTWAIERFADSVEVLTDYVANGSFASLRKNVKVTNQTNFAFYVRLFDLRRGIGHKEQKYVDKESYDFLKKSSLFGGEILMANVGEYTGEVHLMPSIGKPATLAPNMVMFRLKSGFRNDFIFYYLKSENGKRNIDKIIGRTGQPKLNKTELRNLKLIKPSLEEQCRIIEILLTIDSKIVILRLEKERLERVKQGLMDLLLSGKVRIKVV